MKYLLAVLLVVVLLVSCSRKSTPQENGAENSYRRISQEEAKTMMDEQDVIILDVREQSEYDGGHIAGAVLLPVGSIDEESAADVIPEKDSVVLVYCRSGNRSKTASQALADLGYINIYEFGGVITWSYGLVR